jgi:hypothetical protein
LVRLYAPEETKQFVLGVNICFHDHPRRRFPEPIFVVANSRYTAAIADSKEEAQRLWDPWSAFLDWNSDRRFGEPLTVPPGRGTIEHIVVAAAPLYSITSLEEAMKAVRMVGRPSTTSAG